MQVTETSTPRRPWPLYGIFVQFPAVCFTLTMFTDIAYWQTSHLMWKHFSSWLLFAGLVFAAVAVIAAVVDWLIGAGRGRGGILPRAITGLVVLLLSLVNSLVHASDGWTGVVPWGLALSVVTVLVMCVGTWIGERRVHRSYGETVNG